MATTYTDLLRLALPVQGELEGSWGDTINAQITSMLEEAIAGRVSIVLSNTNDVTLSSGNGATDQSRPAILNFTGTPGGAVNIICPTKSKTYVVSNNSNQTITIKTSGGTGQAVTAGTSALVSCDGTNVIASAATTAQGTKADNALPKTGGAMTGAITTNSTFDGVDVAARDAVLTSTTTTANAALPKTTNGNDLTISTGDAILSPANSNLVIQGAGTTDNYVQFGAGGEFEISVTGTGAGSRVDLSERNVGASPLAINGRDVEFNTTYESGSVGAGLIVLSGSTSTSIRISSTDPLLATGGIANFNVNGAGNAGTDWCWMQTGNANKANAPVSAASEAGGVITITLARPLSGNNVPAAGDECALGQEILRRVMSNNSDSGGVKLFSNAVEATGGTTDDYTVRVANNGITIKNAVSSAGMTHIGVGSNEQAIQFTQVTQTDATSKIAMNVREVAITGASSAGPSANVKPAGLAASPSIVVTASQTVTAADMFSYRGKRIVFKGTPAGGIAVALPQVQPTSGSYLGTAYCLLGDTWRITNANTGPRQAVFTVPTNASVIWIKEDGSAPSIITAGNTFTAVRGSVAEVVVVDDTSGATVFTLTGTNIT